MNQDPETIYRQIGRLIETMPDFSGLSLELSPEHHLWIGRAGALVNAHGQLLDTADWRAATKGLQTAGRPHALEHMRGVLYRLLATAELKAPAGVGGSFIPVGNSFDAFAALSKLLQSATRDVLIVDPYMDEVVLTEFAGTLPNGVSLRLLTDQATSKASLTPAATRWIAQHGAARPLAVRLAAPKTLHDRAIFIDQTAAWTLTQSLKDFAKRSPAEIVRADDTAALKIDAYETIWVASQILA